MSFDGKRLEEIKKLYEACFPESPDCVDYMFSDKLGLSNCFYIIEGGKVVTELFLVNKKLYYSGRETTLPFMVAVATDESFRNRGLATKNIKNALQSVYFSTPFVMLYPDVRGFYKKLGFNTVSFDYYPAELKTRPPKDDGELLELYKTYTEKLDYYLVRDENAFAERRKELNLDGSKFSVLTAMGKSVGYVSSEENLVFDGSEGGYKKGAMARVVNVEKAFSMTDISFDFGIKLTDGLLPENNVTFSVKKGKVNYQEKYRYEIDVSELTALLFGVSSDKRLRRKFPKLSGRIFDRY